MNLRDIEKSLPLFSKIQPIKRKFDEEVKDSIYIDPPESNYRILNFHDLHAPYIIGDLIRKALELELAKTHLPEIKYVIVGADVNQFDELARFIRQNPVSLKETILQSRKVIELLAEHWQVYVLTGNHDLRPERLLIRILGKEIGEAISDAGSFLDWSTKDLARVKRVPFHILKIHDVSFAHYERASVIYGRTAEWARQFIGNLELYGELPGPASRCVVQGHNHRVCAGLMIQGVWCIETGCLCPNLDYVLYGASAHSRRELFQHGYASLVIRDGKVSTAESQGVCLDSFEPRNIVKKEDVEKFYN